MNLTPENQKDFDSLPAALRQLLEAELAAGNEIVEVAHCFPSPPAGAYFKLARPVSTCPRASHADIHFYDRNNSSYSGEFTDAKRFYFILEPPLPPPPEPDMDAIRAEREEKQRVADARLYAAQLRARSKYQEPRIEAGQPPAPPKPPTLVDHFRESMVMNYERWHDGIGYDLDLLKRAAPEELAEIENLLVSRGVSDWRDVEALAALNSPRAGVLLLDTLKRGKRELAVAVLRYAPNLVSETDRTATLVAALEQCDFYSGLTQTLREVETFHPPQVIAALLRGALARNGDVAVHFAAMLMFLHGKTSSAFDWDHRPFFLKFNTDDRGAREQVFRELCAKIGVEPGTHLQRQRS